MADNTISARCNSCMRDTEHDVVWEDKTLVDIPDGSGLVTKVRAIRCRGCRECAIRGEEIYFDGIPDEWADAPEPTITFYSPPRLWHRPPDWIQSLEESDPDLKGLLDEIYSAANDSQIRLLSMGVRAALDHLMIRILGGDVGGFEASLDALVAKQHLTSKQKDNLAIVIDAGSASAHRGYKPTQDLLEQMLAVMERLIHEHYITGPMLETAKTQIPPRPPRQRIKKDAGA
jgi:hypothetical protein